MLPSRPAGGRYWTVAAGLTGELLVVGLLLLAPLIWTDFLPRVQALNWISLPSPPPPAADTSASVDGGVKSAPASAVLSLFDSLVHIAPPERRVAQLAVTPPVKSPPAEPRRISVVQPARLLHRVEPIYPALARTARISGTVELRGVIVTDGRIRELADHGDLSPQLRKLSVRWGLSPMARARWHWIAEMMPTIITPLQNTAVLYRIQGMRPPR